ncbi:MAG: SHOCT domain-containing protein [Planctomycetota bacterium]
MSDEPVRTEERDSEAQGPPLLPSRLSPFALPDPAAEERTCARLQQMTNNQLRLRRDRIDTRLFELGLSVGEPALLIPSVRGTGLVDIDRILRKLDRLTEARDQARLERELAGQEGGLWSRLDLSWLSEAFRAREIRSRRQLLTSELGLALCACDQRVLAEWTPHLERLLAQHVQTARRIDELFVEMRLLDDELERRAREGIDRDPPKEIDQLLGKALDSVDDVSSKLGGTLANLGRNAARNAVSGGGQAAWALARGAARGAMAKLRGDGSSDADAEVDADEPLEDESPSRAPRSGAPAAPAGGGPAAADVPELIRQLARLRAEGILDDEEYRRKKRQLLDRL